MHPYDASYWKPFTSAAVILTVLYLFGPDRQSDINVFELLLACSAAVAGYFLVLASLGLDASDKYILGKLRERLGVRR